MNLGCQILPESLQMILTMLGNMGCEGLGEKDSGHLQTWYKWNLLSNFHPQPPFVSDTETTKEKKEERKETKPRNRV